MKSLMLAAMFLAPDAATPPSLDAYACVMKGRPGGEKFTLLVGPGLSRAWIYDSDDIHRHTVKLSKQMIIIGEDITPAPDGDGFEIVYELDRETFAIRLLVLVGGEVDASLQGRCEQFKHVAPPPGVRRGPPPRPSSIAPGS
ncbi:MAG: hypothetical protein JNL35_08425 [Sphingopyxis sp.]|nr:hypothetical protein [Sphingopyxis sp.]